MKKVTIFTHGSAKENPGPAAIGVYIVDEDGKVLQEISEAIGNATNNYAEYFAVVRGLQALEELFGDKTKKIEFELKLSNEMVCKQLNARCQIKDVGLIGHFIEIFNIRVASFPNLTLIYIKQKSNKEAGRLSHEAF